MGDKDRFIMAFIIIANNIFKGISNNGKVAIKEYKFNSDI